SRPGSTCHRKTDEFAANSRATAPPTPPRRPSPSAPAPTSAISASREVTTMSNAIEVFDLHKRYGDKVVLNGVDLAVPQGTVSALLGPNGAGKTTIVNILSTLLRPDGGTATVAGTDVAANPGAVRAAIGLTGQFSAVDKLLTGEENLLLMARLRH